MFNNKAKKSKVVFILLLVISAIAGCSSIDEKQTEIEEHHITNVCIFYNPEVNLYNFLPELEKGFNRNGITVQLYSDTVSKCCSYSLNYSAIQGWNLATFLTYAKLDLQKQNKIISSAKYPLSDKFALNNEANTVVKINSVIDELLSGLKLAKPNKENPIECIQENTVHNTTNKKKANLLEIIDLNDHFLISKSPENNRFSATGITIGDTLLAINGITVNQNNLDASINALFNYEVEISILGRGTTRVRGHEVVKKF